MFQEKKILAEIHNFKNVSSVHQFFFQIFDLLPRRFRNKE